MRKPSARVAFPKVFSLAITLLAVILVAGPALADKISHPTAVFNGLDKITGRIIAFEVAINETVQFGSLYVTPRVCYSRPPTETPQTTSFIEVEETDKGNATKKLYAGWMFASSPGLNAVEHPVYDVWLTDCKGGTQIIRDSVAQPEEPAETEAAPALVKPVTRTPRRPVKPARDLTPPASSGPIEIGPPPGANSR